MPTRLPAQRTAKTRAQASPLKITIIYDEIAAGQNAMRALATIGKNFEDQLETRPHFWRTDLLEDSDWFDLALFDGINADILLIATNRSDALNGVLRRWIELCFAEKRGTDAAVVAIAGSGQAGDSSMEQGVPFIQTAAQMAGLAFFAPEWPRHNRLNDRKEQHSLPHQIAGTDRSKKNRATQFAPYDHWGIND